MWQGIVQRLNQPVTLLALAGAALFLLSDGAADIDDAPITYRYAANLADGQGFVYNAGEYLQGTSAPLYAILLAGLHLLSTLDIGFLSNGLNLLFSALTVALAYQFTYAITGEKRPALLAGIFLMTLGPFAAWSMAGMETPLYAFLLLLCLHLHHGRRYLLLGVAGGLLVVTRLDGLILAGFLGLAMTVELVRGRLPWQHWLRTAAPFAALAGAWLAFAQLYFGEALPHSLASKQAHVKQASPYWPFTEFLQAKYLFLLPALGLTALAAGHGQKGQRESALIIGFTALYLLAYFYARLDFYEWYVVPLMPLFAVHFALALRGLGGRLHTRAAGLFLAVNLACCAYDVARQKAYLCRFETQRVAVGEWLRQHVAADASVQLGAIGHIGWLVKGPILDNSGVLAPRDYSRFGDVALTPAPTAASLLEIHDIRDGYTLVRSFPHPRLPLHVWLRSDRLELLLDGMPLDAGDAAAVPGAGTGLEDLLSDILCLSASRPSPTGRAPEPAPDLAASAAPGALHARQDTRMPAALAIAVDFPTCATL